MRDDAQHTHAHAHARTRFTIKKLEVLTGLTSKKKKSTL